MADCDGDGKPEVFVGSEDGKAYCLRGSDGTEKWKFTTLSGVHTPGALADVDGDHKLEFLVSQNTTDTLYCLNAENGTLLWKVEHATDIHSPFVADIDGDGCVKVIVGIHPDVGGYSLFALDDFANTQRCGPLQVEEKSRAGGPALIVRGCELYLFLPGDARVSLALYDASGRLVQRLYDGVLGSGGHTFIPWVDARGVYLVMLRYPGGARTAKIIVR